MKAEGRRVCVVLAGVKSVEKLQQNMRVRRRVRLELSLCSV